MGDEQKASVSVVLGDTQAALFENLGEDERDFEDSNPFPRAVRRSGGSRKGVPNRRTEDFKRYYAASGFRDPLLFLGHMISIDTDDLAKHLACKPAAAMELQRKAAADLAPYLHSKQPARLELGDGEGLPMIVIGQAERAMVADQVASGALSIDGEGFQALSDPAPAPSHGEQSHEPEKREE